MLYILFEIAFINYGYNETQVELFNLLYIYNISPYSLKNKKGGDQLWYLVYFNLFFQAVCIKSMNFNQTGLDIWCNVSVTLNAMLINIKYIKFY